MVLNWKELELLTSRIDAETRGLHVERAFIPARPRFPEGYLKGEWALRLSGHRSMAHGGVKSLVISTRPRHACIALGSAPRADLRPASQATQSGFGLALAKHLRGARIAKVETLPRERVVCVWTEDSVGWISLLIPATPESLLVERDAASGRWTVLASTRTGREIGSIFQPPDGAQAPADPPLRFAWLEDPEAHFSEIQASLDREAFAARMIRAEREVRERRKQADNRKRQAERALSEGRSENDWKLYADLLKSHLHAPPPIDASGNRKLTDYATGERVDVPCDPRLDPSSQVEKFYSLAKRRARRITEAETRASSLHEVIEAAERRMLALQRLRDAPEPDWDALDKIEIGLGLAATIPEGKKAKRGRSTGLWLGASFISRDGLQIWVGRSRDENLELTFKHARGNDVWLHVRGRPGAHAVVPCRPGKSVPLQTLLDAALLTVYYSGGEKWGKTEVDYTFKKYVKRIKGSTEVSYVNNKTLMVDADPAVLRRLLDQRT